ncbi:valine--tRNA ligase [Candidatus Pacearchaeota archaeon]|nr:valine--tRNA ligase [Candidatus Pacearchaeota archaeon]
MDDKKNISGNDVNKKILNPQSNDKVKAKYNIVEAEAQTKKFWDENKIFKFDKKRKGKIFSVDTPPPTVSGKMHIGHAFQYSQQDFITRFWRMKENVFCPFGTDDNGLPTGLLVERLKQVRSKDMSRSEFVKLCLETLKEITPSFIQDWKNIGVSCDYDIYYSTIDDNSRKMSQKSFIDLFNDGRVYKKEFPTLWCTQCQTAIAQAELEDKDLPSKFSTLKFSLEGKDLLIATTRPELLGACVGIFVNPKDKRYAGYVGKNALVPLFNYEVPIIADASADMEKGTGVLMVCSYGDKYDVEAINRHKLVPRLIISLDGTLIVDPYRGMKIRDARARILEDLEKNNLILDQKDMEHTVNVHDKCGTEVEFLTTEQWFIRILDLKKKLISQGKKVKWHPEFMFKRYKNWVEGLEWDWSISRDRHFGVSIPAWFCERCSKTIVASEEELPVDPLQVEKRCPKCSELAVPEEKVFDTWATSSITPQITSSLIGNDVTIPYSVRNNAHDIIRTWDFYTITKSYLHEKKIPWDNMMVSGFVTLKGEKMSKSKGNVIDPRIVLEQYGADALRFWASSAKLGEDLNFQEKDLVTGKKTITKLWNATKFVFMNLEDYDGKKPRKLEMLDKQFLYKLNELVSVCTEAFENYDYAKAKSSTETFFWKMFCDNYLEIVKRRVYNNEPGKKSAQYTLYTSLFTLMKLLAPIMPFITEYIYQKYFKMREKDVSIHLSRWPKIGSIESTQELDLFLDILTRVRQEKSNKKKSMKSEVKLKLSKENMEKLDTMLEDLKNVTNAIAILEEDFDIDFV